MREGWTRVAFGDVVRLSRERTSDPLTDGLDRYVGLEHLEPGDLKIRRWGNVVDGTTFTNVFRPGQVLFGKRRAYQRKVAVADFSGVCSSDIYALEPQGECLDARFLLYLCESERFHQHAVGTSAGSLSPRTTWGSLTAFEFMLPPLTEQTRLVEMADGVGLAIDALLLAARAARVLAVAAFARWLDDAAAPARQLGSLLTERPRNGYSAPEVSAPTGRWVLSLSAIGADGYQRGSLKAVAPIPDLVRATARRGDLLVTRSNTPELVGLVGIFDEDREDVSWPDTMIRLSPDESQVLPRYLELYLRSPSGRQQIRSIAAGTSASMKKINAETLSSVPVPVPSIRAQQHIISQVAQATSSLRALMQRANSLTELRRLAASRVLEPVGLES